MEFSAKLRRLRLRRHLAQGTLAEEIGVSQNLISLWEREKGGLPDVRKALALAKLFGVSLCYLADDALDDDPPGITEDERAVLDAFHLSGLSRREAMGRLVGSEAVASEKRRDLAEAVAPKGEVVGRAQPILHDEVGDGPSKQRGKKK